LVRNYKKDEKIGPVLVKTEKEHKMKGGKDLNSYLILPGLIKIKF
jgi:hypothetical protein